MRNATPEQLQEVLRKSLDAVDRKRRRSMVLIVLLCVLILGNAVLGGIRRRGDIQLTMVHYLAAVVFLVALGTVKICHVSYDNTRRILKAIELIPGPPDARGSQHADAE